MSIYLCDKCAAQFLDIRTDNDNFCNRHYILWVIFNPKKRNDENWEPTFQANLINCFKTFYTTANCLIFDIVLQAD